MGWSIGRLRVGIKMSVTVPPAAFVHVVMFLRRDVLRHGLVVGM